MILDGQRHVVAEHLKGIERILFVQRIAGTASQGDDANELAADLQRANTLEKFGSDVAVRAQEGIVGGTVERHRSAGRSQGVHVAGKQGHQRRFRQQRETLGIDRGQERRTFAEREEHALPCASRFHHGRQHRASGLAEVAVRSKFGPQFRHRFERLKKSFKIGSVQCPLRR